MDAAESKTQASDMTFLRGDRSRGVRRHEWREFFVCNQDVRFDAQVGGLGSSCYTLLPSLG